MNHGSITAGFVHYPHNWQYATSAARLAASGFTSSDLYKLALQTDTNEFWVLTTTGAGAWQNVSFTNPTTSFGDMIVAATGGVPTRLAAPTTAGWVPAWSTTAGVRWEPQSGSGGGGTKTLVRFNAKDNDPPASNYATFNTRNSISVLEFVAGAQSGAVFVGVIPEAADFTTGMAVIIHWMAATATANNTEWSAEFERCNTDLDSDSFAAAVTGAFGAPLTSGIPVTAALTFSGSQIDGITAGDLFRVRIRRNGASDSMLGYAQLIAVELRQR